MNSTKIPMYIFNKDVSIDASSDVKIRRAEKEDFTQVVDIVKGIKYGLDPLANKFFEFLRHPSRFCYVAEIGGNVKAFGLLHIVDGGESMVVQMLRTNASVRGRAVASKLVHKGIEEVLQYHPEAKQVLWTAADSPAITKLLAWNTNAYLVTKRNLIDVKIGESEGLDKVLHVINKMTKVTTFATKLLGKEEITKTFADLTDENFRQLVPGKMWIIKYEPFGQNEHIALVINEDLKSNVCISSKVNKCRSPQIAFVTFGTKTDVDAGIVYRIDCYCLEMLKNEEVLELILEHLGKHLELVLQMHRKIKSYQKFVIGVYFDRKDIILRLEKIFCESSVNQILAIGEMVCVKLLLGKSV